MSTESIGNPIEKMEQRLLLSAYFVSTGGSDAGPGTLAAPFRTIQHAANLAHAGDTVWVRGGVYRETVTPAQSGAPGAPITFAAYNNGNVTISGADPVTDWQTSSGPVYSTGVNWTLGPGNDQVLVDGQMINEARWPNTGTNPSHPALAHATSVALGNGTATLYDPALTQPDGYWTGAYIHIAPGEGWVAQTGQVIAYHPGQLTFTYQYMGDMQSPIAGNGYFLFEKGGALDAPGEWFHDPRTGQLSLEMPAGDSPSAHEVEVKHRLYAFDVRGRSDISLDGINFVAATIASDGRSARLTINHLNAQYVSHFLVQPQGWLPPNNSGIALMGAGSVLENSTIAYSAGDGVFIGGPNCRVTNCVIHDVDYGASDAAAIRVTAANAQIDHNTIFNAGRSGVTHAAPGVQILYNTIHDVMLQTTDGGGTYTVRSDGGGSEIAYNRIYSIHTGGFGAAGIYLDNDSSNYLVDHNLVWDVDAGMKINFSSRHERIYNNTLDGSDFSIDSNMFGDWTGTDIANNIFFKQVHTGQGAMVEANLFSNADPKVKNRASADYELAAGSPAIAHGLPVGNYTIRPGASAPDIGALDYGQPEFVSGASAPGTPPLGGSTTQPPVPAPPPLGDPPPGIPPPVAPPATLPPPAGPPSSDNVAPSSAGGLDFAFSDPLPPQVVGGTRGNTAVLLQNSGDAVTSGTFEVKLYLSPDGSLGSDSILLTTVRRRLRLEPDTSRRIRLAFTVPASAPPGEYRMLAQADSVSAASKTSPWSDIAANPATVVVTPPFVDWKAESVAVGPKRKTKTPVTVTVRNFGNVLASGTLDVQFFATPAAAGEMSIPLGSLTKRVSVRPGAAARLRFWLSLPDALAAGTFDLNATVNPVGGFSDPNPQDNTAAGALAA